MNLALLLKFTRQDLIDRHASSTLGAAWTLILPLVNILIFTLIFSNIMGAKLQLAGMEHLEKYSYSIYLITGLLIWNCFAGIVARTTQVFHDKANLITKVQLTLFSLPLYIVLSETVVYVISMIFFAAFLALIGFEWSWYWLFLPVLLLLTQLMAYAIGMTCAILSVFLRDIKEVVGIAMQLGFWMTPIVYTLSILPAHWHLMFELNPMYHIISALRDALIYRHMPDLVPLAIIALASAALMLFALYAGRRLEKDIRDFI
ncbi:ABC transporter permease [Marinobacterium weihaiense]|uniref:Transport permease protein n=1 Tax=Marinobacterium weihaiense TaxID=2851016 RepID=A0ABS6M7N7_9GAMM|nr:ABC transporter permease [Marinobacterium weihaiense]MBV0932304.1 ABC transporter permease [Marinobacterium weihaiense]